MSNEPIKVFKTSIVGGFDRRDVIDYVKMLSSERNAYKTELADALAALVRADEEAENLRLELEKTRAVCSAAVGNANALADEVVARVRSEASDKIARAEAAAEEARRELREFKVAAISEAAEKLREIEHGIRKLRESAEG